MRKLTFILSLLVAVTLHAQASRWAAPVSITVVQTEEAGGTHPFGGSISLWDTTVPNSATRLDVYPLDPNGSTGIVHIQLDRTHTYRLDLVNNSTNPVIRQQATILGAFLLPVGHANFKVFLDSTTSSDPKTSNFHGIIRIVPDISFEFPPGSFY